MGDSVGCGESVGDRGTCEGEPPSCWYIVTVFGSNWYVGCVGFENTKGLVVISGMWCISNKGVGVESK